jgi:class 3 adenylate cyclase/CheY-like chemotaxis protein
VSDPPKILVVDDTPQNVKLLVDLLTAKDYDVLTAASGAEALAQLAEHGPDLVLLDVVMPEMSGYEVCRKIREDPATRLLPVVMVTALDPSEERVKGIEAGADDFLPKPINAAELLARVRSLLRIRELHEMVRVQADELADWNKRLEERVEEQVRELRRLERLKRFFSPQLAEAISDDGMKLLEPHRRRITIVFVDLRGFTRFAESAEPEEMMDVLRQYHGEMGRIIMQHEGTLERFTGDGMMIFFNDPVEVPDPEERAVRMAVEMQGAVAELQKQWARLSWELGLGIGITTGYATLGAIGFEGRWDYAAIGTVTNRAARLCAAAEDGQILVSDRLLAKVEKLVEAVSVGEFRLKGFSQAVRVHSVAGMRR